MFAKSGGRPDAKKSSVSKSRQRKKNRAWPSRRGVNKECAPGKELVFWGGKKGGGKIKKK